MNYGFPHIASLKKTCKWAKLQKLTSASDRVYCAFKNEYLGNQLNERILKHAEWISLLACVCFNNVKI